MFFPQLIALAVCAQSALAALYTTSPVGDTTWAAGQPQTITWQDDSNAPSNKDFGNAKVTLGVGNAIQQTQLQLIVDSVDVSTTSNIQFTPDPSVGGNGDFYFIRFESLALKDPTQPTIPALGFSAKFTLTGMTGQFNSSVQAQIDGASTAPLGGTPRTSGSGSATSAPATTTGSTSKPSGSSSASGSKTGTAAPTASKSPSSAAGLVASGAAAIAGSIFAAAILL